MKSTVTEIAPDIYRISTFNENYGIQFNQFLVKDEEPFLMHTGFQKMFPTILEAVSSVIEPTKLRWIGYSHFEPDECGALNQWLKTAPAAQPVCSFVGAMVMLNDFSDRPARSLNDGEVLNIGSHRLRFISTPHVPHCWDAGLFFEESARTLLCSDLFFQPGDPEPITDSGIVESARDAIIANLSGPMAKDMPYTPYTDSTLRKLAALAPKTLAIMHGSSFHGDGQKALLGLAEVIKKTIGAQSS
jgi:flavorubredoxin